MALLRLVLVVRILSLSGCYSPDLDDCAVTCANDADCAGDQVCTAQKLCAATAAACEPPPAVIVDAPVGPPMIALRLTVMGNGKISIAGVGECHPMAGDFCDMAVPAGELVIEAVMLDKPFEKWTTLVCAGQPATCRVTLLLDATVGAKFH